MGGLRDGEKEGMRDGSRPKRDGCGGAEGRRKEGDEGRRNRVKVTSFDAQFMSDKMDCILFKNALTQESEFY